MVGVGAGMNIFHGNTVPMANPKILKTDSGTAAFASIKGPEHSSGVLIAGLGTVAFSMSKVRDRLMMSGEKASSSEMEEVVKALAALKPHVTAL